MSLRARLAGFIGILLTVLLAATAILLYWGEKRALLAKIEESQRSLSAGFTQSCGDALAVRDDLAALHAVRALAGTAGLVEAACVDGDGRVAAHTDEMRRGTPFARPAGAVSDRIDGAERLRWRDPARGGLFAFHRAAGEGALAVLVFSQSELQRAVSRSLTDALRRILLVFSGAALVGLAGALVLARSLARPLQDLSSKAVRIGQGDFTARVDPEGGRELETLGRVFNQTAEALGQLDQMKDEFIAMVSHDLRSPLSAIQSFAETLRDERRGPLNEKQKHYLTMMVESARSLASFVNDVLDLAKVRAGRMDSHPEELSVAEAVAGVAGLLQSLAERQNVVLEAPCPADLRVRSDRRALERSLTNLISNALKIVAPGTGRVTVDARREGPHVRVAVTDNGPGLSPEDRSRLFQKFVQLTAGPTNRHVRTVGTGLGLTLVKLLVESQGGSVGVTSELGRGSTFFFTLPAA